MSYQLVPLLCEVQSLKSKIDILVDIKCGCAQPPKFSAVNFLKFRPQDDFKPNFGHVDLLYKLPYVAQLKNFSSWHLHKRCFEVSSLIYKKYFNVAPYFLWISMDPFIIVFILINFDLRYIINQAKGKGHNWQVPPEMFL